MTHTHVLNVWNVPMGLHEPKWLNLELGKKPEPSEPGHMGKGNSAFTVDC